MEARRERIDADHRNGRSDGVMGEIVTVCPANLGNSTL